MPLLPRSRRGIWLLAGAVWVAACAGLWWALPVAPRAEMTLPIDDRLIGFGPNGEKAIVKRLIMTNDSLPNNSLYEIDVVTVPSGQTIATLIDACRSVTQSHSALDGSAWLVAAGVNTFCDLIRIDANSHSTVCLPQELSDICRSWPPVISPDGRIAVFANSVPHYNAPEGPKGAVLWDLETNSIRSIVGGLFQPFAFTRDGRYLAGCEYSRWNCVRVISLDSLATVKNFIGPGEKAVQSLQFNADGSYLTAEFHIPPHPRYLETAEAFCWRVATGEVIVEDTIVFTKFAAGGHALVGFDTRDRHLKAFDLRAGDQIVGLPAEPIPIWADWDVAPDGETLITFETAPNASFLESLLSRCGLKWPWAAAQGKNSIRMYDGNTLHQRESLSFDATSRSSGNLDATGCVHWINNGKRLALLADKATNKWQIWDIPPRKSLTWFAAGAGVLAMPIGLMAWRRVRKLRTT